MKRALIVGHTGQDGTCLWQFLAGKQYALAGISSHKAVSSQAGALPAVDITNSRQAGEFVRTFRPDEVYYLAAVHQSSAGKATEDGALFRDSLQVNVSGLVNFLDAIKNFAPSARLFYAASSHLFGSRAAGVQDETTPFSPDCIYGISKTAGVHACRYYRDAHRVFAAAGILYNHESPLRTSGFVSKKIVEMAVAIKKGRAAELVLGDLKAEADWGYAPDYAEGMWAILQLTGPDDFIIASGTTHTILEFVEETFTLLEMDWKKYVREDPALLTRKAKGHLQGNAAKLRNQTGWAPRTGFREMVRILVNAELEKYGQE